jgi:hypothetical protein
MMSAAAPGEARFQYATGMDRGLDRAQTALNPDAVK